MSHFWSTNKSIHTPKLSPESFGAHCSLPSLQGERTTFHEFHLSFVGNKVWLPQTQNILVNFLTPTDLLNSRDERGAVFTVIISGNQRVDL